MRFLKAKVYRPDGSLFATVDLDDIGNGYHENRSLTFNGDDFWRVEIEVYVDAARTERDEEYPTSTDYLWKKDVSSSGAAASVGGVIELAIENIGSVDLLVSNTSSVSLISEDSEDLDVQVDSDSEMSLEIEEKPSIKLELECEE